MSLFKIKKTKFNNIKEDRFSLERDLQALVEKNLDEIFGLDFVASEFHIPNFYIDTLAFDEEAKSFVIIEYKKDRSSSIVDQGLNYLQLMLNNKADFILEYNEHNKDSKKRLGRDDIDWSQSRVLFIARRFTSHQIGSIGFRDLPIELWKATLYAGNLIDFTKLEKPEARESISTVTKSPQAKRVAREVKSYSARDHLANSSQKVKEIYSGLQERISELSPGVKEDPKKYYIGFYETGDRFIKMKTKVNWVDIELKVGGKKRKINDPKRMLKNVSKDKYWNKLYQKIRIKDKNEIVYAFDLIQQAFRLVYK